MATYQFEGSALLQGSAQPDTKIIAVNQRTGDYYETTSDADGSYAIVVGNGSDQYVVSAVYDGTDGLFPADPQAFVQPVERIPDSGVSRWTFDDADTSGSTAVDVWGNNDATIDVESTGVAGANQTYTTNEAYSFRYKHSVDTGIQSIPMPMSFAAWVNLDETRDNQALVSNYNASPSDVVFRANNGEWDLGVDAAQIITGGSLNAGAWDHLVFVVGESSMYLYQNGSEIASASSGATTAQDSGKTVRIGLNPNSSGGLDGSIDDPRLYDKALSPTEVSNLYNTGYID